MIARKETIEAKSEDALPNSRRIYVEGQLHPAVRVPFREIALFPDANAERRDGSQRTGARLRLQRTVGDSDQMPDVRQGLPAVRMDWIRGRGDVEQYAPRKCGRKTTAI
jgi:phosphomethylpyrimidine synthase